MKSSVIQMRIEPEVKKGAQEVLAALNISMTEAVGAYLRQIIYHKGIPFELKIPNDVTLETIRKLEAGQDVKSFDSTKELFEDLDK